VSSRKTHPFTRKTHSFSRSRNYFAKVRTAEEVMKEKKLIRKSHYSCRVICLKNPEKTAPKSISVLIKALGWDKD
jgi:hypothetical protein